MKKLLSFILIFVIMLTVMPAGIFTFTASAATSGNYTYTVTYSKATITACDTSISGDVIIPSKINGYQVTGISSSAFWNCSQITSITIPNGVTEIGDYAFKYCTNLTSITIPESVTSIGNYVFDYCTNLANVYISDIASWCNTKFSEYISNPLCYADNLYLNNELVTDITIPDGVTNIPKLAFSCNSLTSISFPDSIKKIENTAFAGCINLTSVSFPDSLTSIGQQSFRNCDSLTSITIPNSVTVIGNGAFSDCDNLTSVIFLEGITNIANSMFSDCDNLTSVIIPDSITSIGDYAFDRCNKLTSIAIPDSLTRIGEQAFRDCISLNSIILPDSVIRVGSNAFYNTGYYNDSDNWENDVLYIDDILIKVNNTKTGDFAVKSGTKVIADYALYACSNLTSITVPKSVTNIGDSAFQACSGMRSITLPFVGANRDASETKDAPFGYIFGINSSSYSGGLVQYYKDSSYTKYYIPSNLKSVTITDDETIPYGAFYNCTTLTSVNLPTITKTIGKSAFYNCSSLTDITIPDGTISIAMLAFDYSTSLANISIPDSVTEIGSDAFRNTAYYLDELNWENDVLYIDNHLIKAKETLSGEYTIKQGTKTVAGEAFKSSDITSIIIPNSLIAFGHQVFYGCSDLVDVYITDIKNWCEIDFYSTYSNPLFIADNFYLNNQLVRDLKIPDGTTKIGSYAFSRYAQLTGITLPDTVTSIGDCAFYKCSGLTAIDISNSVTKIGDSAFRECTSLRSVILGTGLETIDEYAFSYCSLITSITVPESVTFIGNGAFESCTGITKVYITDLEKWCKIDFYDCRANPTYFAKKIYLDGSLISDLAIPYGITKVNDFAFINCENIKKVWIPNTVTSIGEGVFKNCRNVTTVKMGNSVETIGREAFYYCDKMYNLKLSTSIKEIGQYSFEYCSGLKSAFFPMGLEKIGYGAFMHCYTNLKTLTIPHTVTEISTYAFFDCGGITNVYYSGTREDWQKISNVSSCSIPSTATFHYNYVYPEVQPDTLPPTAAIRSLNHLSNIQSVLLVMSDDEEVIGFYWGTNPNYQYNIGRMFVYPEASINGLVEVNAPGTYYLTAFDSSNNLSETVSATFYKTTLDANGGIGTLESVITMEGDSFTPFEPTREGFAFVGWSKSPMATAGSKSITPSDNVTYYAVWEEIDTIAPIGTITSTNNDASSQTVTLNLSDNKGVAGFYWGTGIEYSDNDFVATSRTSVDLTISAEGTYYLTVVDTSDNVSKTVSITFYKTTLDCQGGSARIDSILTKAGNTFTFPTPTREGYEFVGWSEYISDDDVVTTLTPTRNSTYYAVWKDTTKPTATISSTNNVDMHQTVTLTFTDNEGIAGYYWGNSSNYLNNNYVAKTSKTVKLTVFVSGTYYLTVKDKSGNVSETVSATFYKTTLDARGGEVYPDTIITMEGNSFTLPTPERDGYEFDEWSGPSYDTQGNMTYTPQRDILLYAFWIDKTKPTGRIESTNDLAPTQTVTLYISDNETIDGYYWGTEPYYANNRFVSGAIGEYEITEPGTYYLTVRDKNLNLSDTVSANFYQTYFDATGGMVDVDTILTMEGNLVITPVPERDGYYFLGWSRYPNDSTGVKSITPEGNHTYYAIWQDITNPIGSISASNDVAPTQTVTLTLLDEAGIAGYYWGMETYYPDNEYFVCNEETVTFTVSEQGTYYLTVVDVNGNVSETVYETFYKTWFDARGGDLSIDSVLTLDGNSFIAPIPEKENYTFDGWILYDENEDGNFEIAPQSNDTYFAKWMLQKPNAPQNLYATLYGYDDVRLSWDAVEGANRYYVSYKKSSELTYTKAYIVTGNTWSFSNLADNTNYDFSVIAVADDAGEMISSDPATIRLKTSCPLGKVSTFTATLYGHDDVELNWGAVAGATGYKVYYKKATAKNYTYLTTTPARTYSIANLTDNCKYNFKIVPVATYGTTTTNGTAKVVTYSTAKDLAAPKTLKASLYGYDDAKLTWSAVSGASRYKIYYKQSSADTYKYKTYTTKTTYNFANLYDGVSYDFKIVPCSYVNGTHFEDNSFKTVTISSTINLTAPTTVTAKLYGYDDVDISWSAVENADAYKVYYKKSTSKTYTLKTTTTALSQKICNLSDGIKYDFKIVPCTYVNGTYFADDSYKTASIYTLKKISTPTVTKHKAGKVKITWGNIQGESGYEISRSTSKTGTYIVSDLVTTTKNAVIVSATKGKTYYYKVRAYKIVDGVKIYSPWSSVKSYKLN